MDEIRNPIVALVAVTRYAGLSGRGSPFHSLDRTNLRMVFASIASTPPTSSKLLMHKLPVVALLTAALLATGVRAQELWGGLRAGMTVDEVQTAYPSAKPELLKPLPSGRPHPNSALLVLTGLTLAERPFKASFWFRAQGGLVQIGLSPVENATQKGQAMEIAQRLLTSLRQKYGPELNAEIDKRDPNPLSIVTSRWTWAQGDVAIVLRTSEMETSTSLLGQTYITYSPGAKRDAEKL